MDNTRKVDVENPSGSIERVKRSGPVGRPPGPSVRLRRLPVGASEAARFKYAQRVKLFVFPWGEYGRKRGWRADGVVVDNNLADRGQLLLAEVQTGRRAYAIPWRYFANGLVFIIEKNGDNHLKDMENASGRV